MKSRLDQEYETDEEVKAAHQIIQDKLEITTLVQGLGMSETNAPKLMKFTEEDIKFVDLYEVCVQDDGRDRMVDLIAPTSFGYAVSYVKWAKIHSKWLPTRIS